MLDELKDPFTLGWVVGLLEGEGCFASHPTSHIAVHVESTDLDTMERYKNAIHSESNIVQPRRKRPHHRQSHRLSLYGPPAVALMRCVRPYMGKRRKARIEELLSGR